MKNSTLLVCASALCANLFTTATQAAEYLVPSPQCPTLQAAVDAAALSEHGVNYIYVSEPRVFTGAEVVLGDEFNANRKLVIQPNPRMPALRRATVVSRNGNQPIFRLIRAGYVAFFDLDIVRFCTNNENLMVLQDCTAILIDSCRVGSIWNSVGSPGWCNLVMSYPEQVVVRNSIFFSMVPANFDRAISASLGDDSNSILLYNNVVADHRWYGIEVAAHTPGSLVLLRNNVVVNRANQLAAPAAFHSAVGEEVTVISTHNAAFAAMGQVETIALGAQSISGLAAAFLRFEPQQVDDAFVEHVWDADPLWDPNVNFYRLEPHGPLHDDLGDAGVTVRCGVPHPRDIPVFDDIEGQPRPHGQPLHTDRGVDQIMEDDALVNLAGLALNPANVLGGATATGIVTLNGPAPEGGALITLASGHAAAQVPASVTVPAGALSANFTINTTPAAVHQVAEITANYHGLAKSQTLAIRTPALANLILNPIAVQGGAQVRATVTLEAAAVFNTPVLLASSHPNLAAVPPSVTIPAGSSTASFVIQTARPLLKTAVTIRAAAGASLKSATLTLSP